MDAEEAHTYTSIIIPLSFGPNNNAPMIMNYKQLAYDSVFCLCIISFSVLFGLFEATRPMLLLLEQTHNNGVPSLLPQQISTGTFTKIAQHIDNFIQDLATGVSGYDLMLVLY